MTINNCQSNDGNRKSPFGKHHSDTFFSLDAKLKVKIGYLYCFKISFLEILINYKREKPGRHHLKQVIKVNIASNETYRHHGPLL